MVRKRGRESLSKLHLRTLEGKAQIRGEFEITMMQSTARNSMSELAYKSLGVKSCFSLSLSPLYVSQPFPNQIHSVRMLRQAASLSGRDFSEAQVCH